MFANDDGVYEPEAVRNALKSNVGIVYDMVVASIGLVLIIMSLFVRAIGI